MATRDVVQWKVQISEETDASLRAFLDEKGMNGSDLSRFVKKAVNAQLFREAMADTGAHNRDVALEVIEAEVDRAVREVRGEMSEEGGADVQRSRTD